MAGQSEGDRIPASAKAWSDHVAGLVVDALIDGGLIGRDDFQRAVDIVSEEVFARLCVRDYPPVEMYEKPSSGN